MRGMAAGVHARCVCAVCVLCVRLGRKSTLLQAILGECFVQGPAPGVVAGGAGAAPPQPGGPLISLCGSVAYAAQQPWLTNATVRDNGGCPPSGDVLCGGMNALLVGGPPASSPFLSLPLPLP